jgi:hypothetical protein
VSELTDHAKRRLYHKSLKVYMEAKAEADASKRAEEEDIVAKAEAKLGPGRDYISEPPSEPPTYDLPPGITLEWKPFHMMPLTPGVIGKIRMKGSK